MARRGSRRTTVALVSHSQDLGGAELCLLRFARGLQQRGVAPLVILPSPRGPLADELEDAGIDMAKVDNAWWATEKRESPKDVVRRLADVASCTRATYRVLRENQVEVVGTASSVIPEGALAARLAGARHVWHVRELYPTDVLHPMLGVGPTLGIIQRLSSAVLVPSRRVGNLFGASAKVQVVPEGIDRRYFDEPRQDVASVRAEHRIASGPIVMVAGTIEPAKGQLDAVRVLAGLAARGVVASLLLCGRAPHQAFNRELAETAAALGVAERLHLLGFHKNPIRFYDAADVLLVASQRESFGLTIVEAMARGVPVVATRCGGPEELVLDGITGCLVGTGDVEAMTDRIRAILGDRALAERLGARGRGEAGRYHPDANLAQTLAGYGLPS
jgi:glycosyltransferase involved in cell wall biosynthesis